MKTLAIAALVSTSALIAQPVPELFFEAVSESVLPEASLPIEEVVSLVHETALPALAIEAIAPSVQDPTLNPPSIEAPAPLSMTPRKSPNIAATLSSILPGLGHMYIGDAGKAGYLFGATFAGLGAATYKKSKGDVRTGGMMTLQTAYSYGVYSAYRDARLANKGVNYSYQMPTDSFFDMALAPFRPSVLKKPEVWGGVLGFLAGGVALVYLTKADEASHVKLSTVEDVSFPGFALPIAISEEALFRGFLQSQLSETFNPGVGFAVSSLIFGAAHIPNAILLPADEQWRYYTFSLPFITAIGAYLGWMANKNHSLKESVALHFWYDFALMSAGYLASKASAVRQPTSFCFSVPF